MYGLLDRDIEYMNKAFRHFDEIEKVVLFGSGAMGNYKKGSDVDIAVFGRNISNKTIIDKICTIEYLLSIDKCLC
ncbi:nucleotidyltransferase domain-containing protein [uncultured Clostridium sp.]|uniref:nucleotidyltransferase domain-containing protein n=1 Tax=uncultured Clostridium sp. TaxID=59620 RepID=UPI0025E354A0|nr:nucleotidyltransferase domain-containing protein [uncultured Clostridium sp.]